MTWEFCEKPRIHHFCSVFQHPRIWANFQKVSWHVSHFPTMPRFHQKLWEKLELFILVQFNAFLKRFISVKILFCFLLCGSVCVCLISGRRAESGEIPPVGDRCESAFEDQGKSTQLKSVINGRCYLRGEFEFPRVTPLVDFIHVLCYLLCLFTCNKLFNFTGLEIFIWTYHFHMCLCKVTQRITTGVISLEASVSSNRKGLTLLSCLSSTTVSPKIVVLPQKPWFGKT